MPSSACKKRRGASSRPPGDYRPRRARADALLALGRPLLAIERAQGLGRRVLTIRREPVLPAHTPLIEALCIANAYPSQVALHGSDLRVEEGRVLGLIGPNGAGKTTALMAILGLRLYRGELRLLGRIFFKERGDPPSQLFFPPDVAVL